MWSINQFMDEYRSALRALKEEVPDSLGAFNSFYQQVMQEGVLDAKTKELIALAVGVAIHCESCVLLHTRAAHKAGASREEILEAAFVGVVMGGGPAFTFLPVVKRTLDELGK